MSIKLSESDVYVNHLSEVNQSNRVIANEDIYNSRGALLVKKGASINKQIADKIIKFKLLKPLETQVSIENDISGERIFQGLQKRLENRPEIFAIHRRLKLDKILKYCCVLYSDQKVLRQKLTVLRLRMPDMYQDSMIAGWLSMAIANQLGLAKEVIGSAFIAGISHDIGMLHINPDIISKPGELAPEEWRQIQAHVVIGQRIFEHIETLKSDIANAVFEHHECCDGTGYPVGKFGSELNILGQIVGMSDTVIAVYARLAKNGGGLRDLIPIIQVNNKIHFYKTYEAVVRVLRSAKLSEVSSFKDNSIEAFINKLVQEALFLKESMSIYEETINLVSPLNKHRKIKAIEQVWSHVVVALRNSGIVEDCYFRWLDHVRDERLTSAYREAEDVGLMLQEIGYHLQRMKRMLYLVIEINKIVPAQIKHQVIECLSRVESGHKKLTA